MRKTLGTLLACVAATTALSAPATSAVPAAAGTRYDVAFGQIVQSPSGEATSLVFDGSRDQLVTLRTTVGVEYPRDCESIVLSRRGTVVAQEAPGFWRLPATGTFRVDYTQSCEDVDHVDPGLTYTSRVSVARVVVGRLGDPLRHGLDRNAPTVRAVSVRLDRRPLLLSEAYVVPVRRTAEARSNTQGWCSPSRLVAGKKPRTSGRECRFRARAGARYLILGTKDSTVRLGRA